MDVDKLIEQLQQFKGRKVLVHNGETLCAISDIAENVCTGDPDDGAAVIYLEE